MNAMTDRELMARGFQALVAAFGDVNAERFIALTMRDPLDYTKWREKNMYVGDDVHSVAERARAAGQRFKTGR